MKTFSRSFLQQESLPESSIEAVIETMRSGRLHRYDATPDDPGHTALLEQEFARYQGSEYCLACASCGYAIYLALIAAGVTPGDKVLTNAFTLAPVPGAINNSGAVPLLIETSTDLNIDLFDLEAKARDAKFLLLSHMRGHMVDMDRIMDICERFDLTLVEDCAHTMGAFWGDKRSGSHGKIACFSTQTYKHLNSGEGGLLVTDDPQVIAQAILLSGSYMLYEKHLAAPNADVFTEIRLKTPNYSGRMDNMRAASLRPQLKYLDDNCQRWNERYVEVDRILRNITQIKMPERSQQEKFVGSSIQFLLPEFHKDKIDKVVSSCGERGVQLKYFGGPEPVGYTSRYDSWQYIKKGQQLPQTMAVLEKLLDMRIPLTFTLDDCRLIAEIIAEVIEEVDD